MYTNTFVLLDAIESILSKLKVRNVKKGTIVQRQGDFVNKSYYVKSGLLRNYTIDEKGKEHIFTFAPAGWIIADIESHISGQPAELFVDALENSEIYELDTETISVFDNPEVDTQKEIKRLVKRIGVLQKRIIMLMSASALERYDYFVKTYPNIVNRVPQKMIASYLGITPEALSKILSKRHKQNIIH